MTKVLEFTTGKEGPFIFGKFMLTHEGVFRLPNEKKGETDPEQVCGSLRSVALVRDEQQKNWGSLVSFFDGDGKVQTVIIGNEMLVCSGDDVVRLLANYGLWIKSPQAKRLICEYLIESWPTERVRLVNQTGWYGSQFVLPNRIIGSGGELLHFVAGSVTSATGCSGSLQGWQQNVGRYCVGNSRLLLAVSAAFAGPLLSKIGFESGGINFCGSSSCGKSTALRVSASVYGDRRYMQSWRATANGLEGTAVAHNHCLLILDELGQIDPREAGDTAYMLANGRGKTRASRAGDCREPAKWHLFFLSSGEVGLQHHMQSASKSAKAGQELRLVDVPADAGAAFGMFEMLHDCSSGAAFADLLNSNTTLQYGTPIVSYLEKLTAYGEYELPRDIEGYRDSILAKMSLDETSGQVERVAKRFAVVGAAGELATMLGVTGWRQGDATWGAIQCFDAWLKERGSTGQTEHSAYVDRLLGVLEMQSGKFLDLGDSTSKVNGDCYGFKRLDRITGCYEYFVFSSAWKSVVCEQHNPNSMAKYLLSKGYLAAGPNNEPYITKKLDRGDGEKKATKCYHVLPALFLDIAKTAGNLGNGRNEEFDPDDIPFP